VIVVSSRSDEIRLAKVRIIALFLSLLTNAKGVKDLAGLTIFFV